MVMKILILISFFEIKESKITRGHNYMLVKKQSRLDVRKYSFSQRTINIWNNLSTDCVHASSVNMFKNKIDKYLDNSVLPRLLLQGAAPCPLFVTPCPFEKAEMTPCPFD